MLLIFKIYSLDANVPLSNVAGADKSTPILSSMSNYDISPYTNYENSDHCFNLL